MTLYLNNLCVLACCAIQVGWEGMLFRTSFSSTGAFAERERTRDTVPSEEAAATRAKGEKDRSTVPPKGASAERETRYLLRDLS